MQRKGIVIVVCEVCVQVSCVISDGGALGVKLVNFGIISCVVCAGGGCCTISEEDP